MNQISVERNLYQEDLKSAYRYIGKLKSNPTILITGASGLIGSFLVDTFVYYNRMLKIEEENKRIKIYCMSRNLETLISRFSYCVDSDCVNFICQDICEDLNKNTLYDYIIHAASNSDPRNFSLYPVETITANVTGTVNVLEYAKLYKSTKVVFVSSREVYGIVPNSELYKEDEYGLVDFNSIRSGYPESKRVAELLCRSYAAQYNVECSIARLGYVYGPSMTDEDSRVIAQFLRNAVNGQNIVLKSKGDHVRSYCYILDAVTGILSILFAGKSGEAYNVTNQESIVSINKLAEIIAQIAGTEVILELPDEIEEQGFSKPQDAVINELKLRDLGWNPVVDLVAGLQRTIKILKKE